ncbi:MAG: secondary thiamine-phosphate synthase enzyme YjbQ [Methanobacterium paludis]|nr:secondary thiamine-phosphate synthase enzyme YjbQ [Methanobacterium paludis]
MNIVKDILDVKTNERVEILDITPQLKAALIKTGIKTGLVTIFSRHSTSGIVINENESGLIEDFKNVLESLVPTSKSYKHNRIDNNADSHIRSFIIGSSETIPIESGSLGLGTWQSIFFVELDGPRNRKVTLTFIGE